MGSAYADEKSRRWKVVCYAADQGDVPYTFQTTLMALTPFVFVLAIFANLRARPEVVVAQREEKKR
jgi:hypothetical protein